MAEALIRARAHRAGLDGRLDVGSVGTWTVDGAPASGHAQEVMRARGLDLGGHRSREVKAEAVAWADVILTMTADHQAALEAEFAAARGKTRRLSSLAGGSWDVADPMGGELDDYRATADELERLVDAGWAVIAAGAGDGGPEEGS